MTCNGLNMWAAINPDGEVYITSNQKQYIMKMVLQCNKMKLKPYWWSARYGAKYEEIREIEKALDKAIKDTPDLPEDGR